MPTKKTQTSVFTKLSRVNRPSLTFYYYFKKIKVALKDQNWSRNSKDNKEYNIFFESSSFAYTFDAIDLVQRVFARMGWNLKLKVYALKDKNYTYNFTLMKK